MTFNGLLLLQLVFFLYFSVNLLLRLLALVSGQPDYTAQWIEYYKSMGMLEEAAMIENQMKQNSRIIASAASMPQAVPDNFVTEFYKTLDDFADSSVVF